MVLQPEHLEEQLNIAASQYINKNVKIDEAKKVVMLPQVCGVFRYDFTIEGSGAAAAACLQYCLGFLEEDKVDQIHGVLRDNPGATIKFQQPSELYHTYLRLEEFVYLKFEGQSGDP